MQEKERLMWQTAPCYPQKSRETFSIIRIVTVATMVMKVTSYRTSAALLSVWPEDGTQRPEPSRQALDH